MRSSTSAVLALLAVTASLPANAAVLKPSPIDLRPCDGLYCGGNKPLNIPPGIYTREIQDDAATDELEKRVTDIATLTKEGHKPCDGCAVSITPNPGVQSALKTFNPREFEDLRRDDLEARAFPGGPFAGGMGMGGPPQGMGGPLQGMGGPPQGMSGPPQGGFPGGPNFRRETLQARAPPFAGMGGGRPGGFPGGRPNFPREDLDARASPFAGMGGGRPGGFPGGHSNFPRARILTGFRRPQDKLEARAPPFAGMGGGRPMGGFPGGRPNFPRDDLETRAPPFAGMGGGRPGGFRGGRPRSLADLD
ncbi:hypothetical protein K474DRAFT_1098051 [Panus rudis PR-1116 ss-1]|nr:hypothetical protein K474DRAFT_1098051 [Panus rudis PR-1116 ss-1]